MRYLRYTVPMQRQTEIYYQALRARDPRFDGKFFVGVKTTGIYCRPICPARPKLQNVEFFPDANAAERAGYRPCLRCRPECAPQSPAWVGKTATVQRALRLISTGSLNHSNENQFAAQLGVSARHLRRLFVAEIGQTPQQIWAVARLNFARKLITETRMPMTVVAETSGFQSLRRFNDAFKKRFHRSPGQLRKTQALCDNGLKLSLAFRPPYDWKSILDFFDSHRIPGVEQVENQGFERIFQLEGEMGWIRVQPAPHKSELQLSVSVTNPKSLFEIVARVRRMFDLDSDPLLVTNSLTQVQHLARLCERFPGLRLPRAWDPFESAICTILGQLVSVAQARRLIGQLVTHYGQEVTHPVSAQRVRLFPTPATLATVDVLEVKTTHQRRSSIRAFSQKILSGEITLSDTQDPQAFREQILQVPGIGPWTAEYICLRAIGDTDAFPATDLVLKRVLKEARHLEINLVKPWRGYAATYLWKGVT